MKKIRLDVDRLDVRSFATDESAEDGRGTVRALAASGPISCGNSCDAQCLPSHVTLCPWTPAV